MRSDRVGTVAFPVPMVVVAGAFLVLVGIGLLGFVLTRPSEPLPNPIELIGGGELRPGMALLPADSTGVRVAFGDREVSQGQFFRTHATVMADLAQPGSRTACPAQLDAALPVTCLLPYEAATYAEALTRLTNSSQNPPVPLTSCYRIEGQVVRWADRNCTGFRLPTVTEWRRAAGAGLAQRFAGTDDGEQVCNYARVIGCPGVNGHGPTGNAVRPNQWFLYDMTGNVAEIVHADEAGEIRWVAIGGAWDQRTTIPEPGEAVTRRAPNLGFRIVRTVPAPETSTSAPESEALAK